jgi:hypothetical protein
MAEQTIAFSYQFEFNDRPTCRFEIRLDKRSLSFLRNHSSPPPVWSRLEYEQCVCCPLTAEHVSHCPVALNIGDLINTFKDVVSYDHCSVCCMGPDRTYLKETSVMEGLMSIFGIIMASSDCPIMAFLKPMARFHLPFASLEETMVRATSMFLLKQYFEKPQKKAACADFSELERHYAQVKLVNEGLLNRIGSLGHQDADKNALVALHSLSQYLAQEIDFNLTSMASLFVDVNQR